MIATTSATHSGSTHNTITANGGTNQNANHMSTATMHRPAQAATNHKNIVQRFYRRLLLGAFVLLGLMGQSWGQLSITSTGTAYTQNFDGLPTIGTALTATGSIFSDG
ncbi:MAG: hypothetical protein IPO68_10465 [Chitinophagaceae bacterium]|nr:hypothetical protein [Chitinophagaceae bacterium]